MSRHLRITFAILMTHLDREDLLFPTMDQILRMVYVLSVMNQRLL